MHVERLLPTMKLHLSTVAGPCHFGRADEANGWWKGNEESEV